MPSVSRSPTPKRMTYTCVCYVVLWCCVSPVCVRPCLLFAHAHKQLIHASVSVRVQRVNVCDSVACEHVINASVLHAHTCCKCSSAVGPASNKSMPGWSVNIHRSSLCVRECVTSVCERVCLCVLVCATQSCSASRICTEHSRVHKM